MTLLIDFSKSINLIFSNDKYFPAFDAFKLSSSIALDLTIKFSYLKFLLILFNIFFLFLFQLPTVK